MLLFLVAIAQTAASLLGWQKNAPEEKLVALTKTIIKNYSDAHKINKIINTYLLNDTTLRVAVAKSRKFPLFFLLFSLMRHPMVSNCSSNPDCCTKKLASTFYKSLICSSTDICCTTQIFALQHNSVHYSWFQIPKKNKSHYLAPCKELAQSSITTSY